MAGAAKHAPGTFFLSVAAFSGTCGWVEQDHCPMECTFRSDEYAAANGYAYPKGTTEAAVEANSVDVSNHNAVVGYCAAWRTKIARVRPNAAEPDRPAPPQAALRFCTRAMQVATDKHGGVAHVVVCTDGAPPSARPARRICATRWTSSSTRSASGPRRCRFTRS